MFRVDLLLIFSTLFLARSLSVLLFPRNTVLQITFGLSTPIELNLRDRAIVYSVGFQLQYALPNNITQFQPTVIPARSIRDLTLQDTYDNVENLLNECYTYLPTPEEACETIQRNNLNSVSVRGIVRELGIATWSTESVNVNNLKDGIGNGWNDGRECLLRSICELAETPLERDGQDFFEEVIHLLLTPSEDLPEAFDSNHRSVHEMYHEAERLGGAGRDCILAYPNCIESPLESFTKVLRADRQ